MPMEQMQDIKTTNNINKKILVMRAKKSEDIFFDKETVNKLLKSEEDIEKGRTKKASEVLEELREKYGF
jgi:hypothetical protein